MSSRPAQLYTCDIDTCAKSATVRRTKEDFDLPPPPSGWVCVQTIRGTDNHGDHITEDGLTFCSADHASRWFKEATDRSLAEPAPTSRGAR